MNEFNRYFEKINPKATPEELTESVISSTENAKTRRKPIKFIGIIAAAAAVMTLGVTSAASGVNYLDIFSNLFGEKAENLTHNVVEEAVVIRNETEKMDFKLVAAAADKHSVLAIVEVTAKDGFKLGENHIGDARADFWFDINPVPDSGGGATIHLIEGNEKTARVSILRTCSEDITGREVLLTIGEPAVATEDIWQCVGTEEDKKWQIKFTAQGECLEYEADGMKISVSPISVCFDSNEPRFTAYASNLNIITEGETITSEGTTVTVKNPGVSIEQSADGTYSEQAIFTISEPIDPESVIALEVNGQRYDLK